MRKLSSLVIAAFAASMLTGCSSNTTTNDFTPTEDPTELSAYSAKNPYPSSMAAKDNPQLTALINHSNGMITVRNFGNGPVENFKLWVNQTYVLHVNRIEPNSSKVFNLPDLYNSAGNNMKDLAPTDIHKIQIETTDGQLWNVQGPQMD